LPHWAPAPGARSRGRQTRLSHVPTPPTPQVVQLANDIAATATKCSAFAWWLCVAEVGHGGHRGVGLVISAVPRRPWTWLTTNSACAQEQEEGARVQRSGLAANDDIRRQEREQRAGGLSQGLGLLHGPNTTPPPFPWACCLPRPSLRSPKPFQGDR
jgi:hypothetical protein